MGCMQIYEEYQKVNILWVDKNVNEGENMEYQNKIQKIKQIKLFPFTNINDCITELKKIKFEKTFIIISGSLSLDFFKEMKKQENINKIKVIPEIIIFTSYKRFEQIKINSYNENFILFDNNLIYCDFDPVKKQLQKKQIYKPNKTNQKENSTTNGEVSFTFEYIKDPSELRLPLYYKDFIDYPNKNEITDFNHFLLDNFSSNCPEMKKLITQLLLNINIPCEILVKYWLRAYTSESDFYKKMNDYLIRQLGNDYDTYIKVVYNALHINSIVPSEKKILYRGAKISIKEILNNILTLEKKNMIRNF